MTRKDYELIAFVIGTEISMKGDINSLIEGLGQAFNDDNPNFNYEKFEARIKYFSNPNAVLG